MQLSMESLFLKFCSESDEFISKLYELNGYVYATDARIMIRCPKENAFETDHPGPLTSENLYQPSNCNTLLDINSIPWKSPTTSNKI